MSSSLDEEDNSLPRKNGNRSGLNVQDAGRYESGDDQQRRGSPGESRVDPLRNS